MTFELSANNAVGYLVDRGVLSERAGRSANAVFLGGGVSNVVIKVQVDASGANDMVLKQSLPKLRVEEDWFADRKRIHREKAGLELVDRLRGEVERRESVSWSVPEVVHEDRDNFVFAMRAAPAGGSNWKEQLLAGHIDECVAGQVGEMLGLIHRRTTVEGDEAREDLREFADLECFVQLRIDPYHRATAVAHPELAGTIESEAQRMLPSSDDRRALVHGDFSPKNIIVVGEGVDARVVLLDFEVVHLGNPVFDLAFMMNHFTLKAIHRPPLADSYCDAARRFWSGYVEMTGSVVGDEERLEQDTLRQMGALLLARIDGKSPAEYITDEVPKRQARDIATRILLGRVDSFDRLRSRLSDGGPTRG